MANMKKNIKKEDKEEQLVLLDESEVKQKEVNVEDIKSEILDYVKNQVDLQIRQEIDKTNRRIIRMKNYAIFWKYIIILFFMALSSYLGYRLYETGYFDKYMIGSRIVEQQSINSESKKNNSQGNEQKNEEVVTKDESKDDKKEDNLKLLVDKYEYLLKELKISENNKHILSYYKGNLSEELKFNLAFNQLKKEDIEMEDDMSFIDEEKIKAAYEKLFLNGYQGISFQYGDINVKYSKSQKLYLINQKMALESSNIIRNIIDIKEETDRVAITTVEGFVSNNKLFNILTKKEIVDYKNGVDLNAYRKDLNVVTYIFMNNKDQYYLFKISV